MAKKKGMTKEERRKKIQQGKNIFKRLYKLVDDINYKQSGDIKKAFNRLKKTVIGDSWNGMGFYGSFYPEYYRRKYDLYHIPEIEIDRDTGYVHWEFSPYNLNKWHRVYSRLGVKKGKEYLYELCFVDGFHGGARSGGVDDSGRPFPGNYNKPYWRRPPEPAPYEERYRFWGRPAIKSKSPLDEFYDAFMAEANKIIEANKKLLKEETNKALEELKVIVNDFKNIN